MRWWTDRMCICAHPRVVHGDGRGWKVCHALRCDCVEFVWAPIARAQFIFTGRVHRDHR